MSDLFDSHQRPKAEQKVIDSFFKLYNKAQKFYKKKEYPNAIEFYTKAFDTQVKIMDILPKTQTLYMLMKSKFYNRDFISCNNVKEKLRYLAKSLEDDKTFYKELLKYKAKIYLYDIIIHFINNELEESISCMVAMIKYVSTNRQMNIIDRERFFWRFFNSFMKFGGVIGSPKYEIFREQYKKMVVKINNDGFVPYKIVGSEELNVVSDIENLRVNKRALNDYKTFMTTKLRKNLYEKLDQEFYRLKYNTNLEDKVMNFLQKNIQIYVRDQNKEILVQKFQIYLTLNKINLQNSHGTTVNNIIHEQKLRNDVFDAIFTNFVGSFNQIFKDYYLDEILSDPTEKESNTERKLTTKNTSNFGTYEKLSDISEKVISELRKNVRIENEKAVNVGKLPFVKGEYNFNEITIPPNDEELNKRMEKYQKELNITQNRRMNVVKALENEKIRKLVKEKYKTMNIRMSLFKEEEDNINFQEEDNKKVLNTSSVISTTSRKLTEPPSFILRNINHFLINLIIDLVTPVFLSQNSLSSLLKQTKDDDTSISIPSPTFPTNKELFNLKIKNYVDSHYLATIKGTTNSENQDSGFWYNSFFMVKNLYLFGICDGHGKYGGQMSRAVSVLFPSYLIYLVLEDEINERRYDINNLFEKVFKTEEKSELKHLHILRYLFDKFNFNVSKTPLFSSNIQLIKSVLYETLSYVQKECKAKYKIDSELSGTTLCSAFLFGKTLLVCNVGDSRAVLGSFIFDNNEWITRQISVDHVPELPEENKRILAFGGRVDKLVDRIKDKVGPFRVFEKDINSNLPGLAMSRSVGDELGKRCGVTFEPELFKYDLNKHDKILVVASDGLWACMTNEEVIETLGKMYENKVSCEEAAKTLVEVAKERWIKNYKKYSKFLTSTLDAKVGGDKESSKDNVMDVEDSKRKKKERYDDISCIVVYLEINN